MNKFFIILFCAVNFATNAIAQLPESLEKMIASVSKAKEDTSKVNLLIDIAWELADYDSAKSVSYIENAQKLAQKIKYQEGLKDAFNCYGNLYQATADYAKSVYYYQKEIEWIKAHNDKALGKVYTNLGNTYASWEKGDSALYYYTLGQDYCKKNNDKKGLAVVYNCFGSYYAEKGNLEKSIEYLLLGLKEKELLNDSNGIAISKSNLSVMYKEVNKIDEALKYGIEAELLYKTLDKPIDRARSLVNNGMLYARKKEFVIAENNYREAISILEPTSNKEGLAAAYSNLALAQLQQNKNQDAKINFEKAIQIGEETDNQNVIGNASINLADIAIESKNYAAALKYITIAENIADKKEYNILKRNVLKTKSEYYAAIGNPSLALNYYKQYVAQKDTLLNKENLEQIEDMKAKYETEKKEQALALQQTKISKQRNIILATIGISTLGLLLGFSFFRNNKLKQSKKYQLALLQQQDASIKAVMDAEENERKRIAADLHDGVGQLLSAAKMNLHAIEDQMTDQNQNGILVNAIALVDESAKDIRSISHNLMPNALLKSGLGNAIKDFIEKIDKKKLQVNLLAEGLNEKLESTTEVVVYRIIQECVNNVIKHAQANRLDITLIHENNTLDITIEDNGKGFDVKQALQKDGIGLKNIKSRVEFINGQLEIDSKPNNGSVISIHIPLNKPTYE